jgi:hypothetical protein
MLLRDVLSQVSSLMPHVLLDGLSEMKHALLEMIRVLTMFFSHTIHALFETI